jgi:hypothetical protein
MLGTALSSPAYRTNIVTTARQCAGARLLMVINDNDWPRSVPVDFTPYRTGQATVRYRIGYDGISTDLIPDSRDSVILAAGEGVVYLFPHDSAKRFVGAVGIAPPGGANRAILHYGYIYKEALAAAFEVDCSQGCTLNLDRSLGPAFISSPIWIPPAAQSVVARCWQSRPPPTNHSDSPRFD